MVKAISIVRSELELDFRRRFFGKDLAECYHTSVRPHDWRFERALRDVALRNGNGFTQHRPGALQDILRDRIAKYTNPKVRILCAANSVLDRDFGCDGFVLCKHQGSLRVVTFVLVHNGTSRDVVRQQADIRIAEIDLSPERIDGLARGIANRLQLRTAIVDRSIFAL